MSTMYSTQAPRNLSFEQCIKCTVCTAYCPVAKVNPLYPGPKQCGPDGERLRLKSPSYYDETLKYCTNCKRCETACPSGVNIGDLIAIARGRYGRHPTSPKTVRDYVLSHTDLMGAIAAPLAPLVNTMTHLGLVKKAMHHTLGVDKRKQLPNYVRQTFRHWFKQSCPDQSHFAQQVLFFHGCFVNNNQPQLGKDLVKVLNAMGIGMQLLEHEKCCGVPLIANGFHEKARKNGLYNIEYITKAFQDNDMHLVSTSSTCAFALKSEYPHVLGIDNSALNERIEYITKYLLTQIMSGRQLKLKPLPLTVLYHTPCHLERSGNVIFTLELLRQIPQLNLIQLDSECCGSAGTYGFKTENYDTSIAIGATLFNSVNSQQADYVITDCETCQWQLKENTDKEVLHPVSLLAMALA